MSNINIPKTCNSSPLKGKDISARGIPINPNKTAPQVGHPTPNAPTPEPINPKNPLPILCKCKLNLNKSIENKIPDKADVIKIATILIVTNKGPDIITEIQMLLYATLATRK